MMPTVDIEAMYEKVLRTLPAEVLPLAETLPHRLGLTERADGGWSEFAQLAPSRDLPWFAAEDRLGDLVSDFALQRYRFAHCCAGFYFLLVDRLADGQVTKDEQALAKLEPHLLEAWATALGEATRDGGMTARAIGDARRRWRAGVSAEQQALAAGALDAGRYGAIVRDKLAWIGVAADALLTQNAPERAAAFRAAQQLLFLGLQLVDDAADADEDQQLRGSSIPGALGVPGPSLFMTASAACCEASRQANASGFQRLAGWLDGRVMELGSVRLQGDPLRNALASVALTHALGISELSTQSPADDPRGRRRTPFAVLALR